MGNVIGIDLGTTNSVVACLENGKPQVMQNAEGGKTTPSIVLYPKDGGDVIVGDLAKRQRLLLPDRTVYSIKRFVGCRWDESAERRRGIEYSLAEGPDGLVGVKLDGRVLLPEQIQAQILMKMRQTAEDYLGEAVQQAVITCPAYFNDSQRQATKKAAELAGLEALRIINEPTAAALAYGLGKARNMRIGVFDFGGGTFDISILEIDGDVFEVKSTCGDTFLGGDAIDRLLMEWIIGQIRETLGLAVEGDAQVLSRIAETAEKVKCELSTLERTTISLPFIGADATGPKHFTAELTRPVFEALIEPVLARLRPPCEQALSDAGLHATQLDSVILVGGSTRIPAVVRLVREIFGRDPDGSVNPDEAVARGAAIQAGIMSGELTEILLLDVTPLSLGIELAGGLFAPLIPRNSSIPTTANKKFTTVRDNQTSVRVHVLQGERKKAEENRTLARFRLEGIAPAPREVPEIEVSFTIDANGILNVSATDMTTGSRQDVRVESYQPTAGPDVDRVIEEANSKADEDRQFVRRLAVQEMLEEMRQEYRARQQRTDLPPVDEGQDRRMLEAIFHMDVALRQDDWVVIENAQRTLKSIYTEIMVGSGAIDGLGNEDFVFEIGDTMKIDTKTELADASLAAPAPHSAPQSTPHSAPHSAQPAAEEA
ncbi:MAG: molecular chaperone DnaK [bacterium]|nr:molecular chaperone DnaK [bacterium]